MSPLTPSQDLWRSEGQLENSPEFQENHHREFPVDASVLEEGMTRRTFIKLLGVTAAIAGLSGCSFRKPKQNIFPYVRTPENMVLGKSTYYASAFQLGEEVTGVLVESFEGRPIKVEGNPTHPQSLGFTKSWQQATVGELYDPDRLKTPTLRGQSISREAFEAWINDWSQGDEVGDGEGLVILTEVQASPTFYRVLAQLQKKYPKAKIFRHEPVNEDNIRHGLYAATGKWVRPTYNFENAKTIVGFDADFLGTDWGNVVYTHQFAKRRDPDHKDGMSRLYAFESRYSLTGGRADHRIRLKPSQVEQALIELAKALGLSVPGTTAAKSVIPTKVLAAIVEDLRQTQGSSLVVAGPGMSELAHGIVALINENLGNVGRSVRYTAVPFKASFALQSNDEAIQEFAKAIAEPSINTVVFIGGNPLYAAPKSLNLTSKLSKIKNTVHLTLFANETTAQCAWALPRTHVLENWSDLVALDGTQSIVQPLIQPLYDTMNDVEFLGYFLGDTKKGFDAVRETWGITPLNESRWRNWLHNGIIETGDNTTSVSVSGLSGLASSQKAVKSGIEIQLFPDYSIYDGRFANNGWLQELPDPITKLTWDNAALISKSSAKKWSVANHDMIEIAVNGSKVELPVWVVPGQADDTISIPMGYGRTHVGRVGEGTGFEVNALGSAASALWSSGATVRKLGHTYKLATTQEHGSFEGRAIYRQGTLEEYKEKPEFIKEMVEHPPLESSWVEKKYDKGYQWGMVIDLNKCTGCSTCLTACQSENNIPIVGKKQVLLSREMFWIRIDRYFEGDTDDAQMVQQPVTCLQCEMAPCEQVCPVAATTHSEEGLNEMTYNRCVGTRYCANNCPTKVRRFNFFDFHQRNPQAVAKERLHFFDYFKEPDKTVQMQFNPDVSVRMRGVMEKCTYCIQRINEVKFTAKNEDRLIKDGEIKTACQQACPAQAITFGDILDDTTEVAKLKKHHRDYDMLEELNIKPRTSYLASIRNPHPKLVQRKEVHA